MTAPALRLSDVQKSFGPTAVIMGVSLDVAAGTRHAIIGPNGAGKTTLLNVISGFYHPGEGRILFEGRDRTRLRPYDVAALGVARTFQNVALFKGMSVLDNIMTGRLLKMHGNVLLDALYWGPAKRQELEHRAFVERSIDFLEIEAVRKSPLQQNIGQRQTYYDLLETMRLVENTARHLENEIEDGKGAPETLATFERVSSLRFDAEETGRRAMIEETVIDALVKAGAIHNQMKPYYYGKR